MMLFEFQLSGTKEQALRQLRQQVKAENVIVAITELIDSAPGNCISMTGSMSGTTDGTHGTLSLSGSFWTPKEKA